MYDLIYGPIEIFDLIKEKYPDAKHEDASDFIHNERFNVEFNNNQERLSDEYISFAIKEGFASLSLGVQMLIKQDTVRIKNIIDNIKKEESEKL